MTSTALEIDGSYGESGGQLIRTAVALSAVTGRPVIIRSIREKRHPPGLAPQHLAAVTAVARLCNAEVEGLALRSQHIRFTPGSIKPGTYRCDVGTAGSITLVLQALLPAMIMSQEQLSITVTGGTDIRQAPTIDYFQYVLLPLLAQMGARTRLEIIRRGYYPQGGGEVVLEVTSALLRPVAWRVPGRVMSVTVHAHVANLPEHIATRMRDSCVACLTAASPTTPRIDLHVYDSTQATGRGGGIVAAANTEHTFLGAARAAERGVSAEAIGTNVGAEVAADLAAGATLDQHAADQLLVFLALAGGGSFCTRVVSTHAHTAMWLIEQFLPVRFSTQQVGALFQVAVTRY